VTWDVILLTWEYISRRDFLNRESAVGVATGTSRKWIRTRARIYPRANTARCTRLQALGFEFQMCTATSDKKTSPQTKPQAWFAPPPMEVANGTQEFFKLAERTLSHAPQGFFTANFVREI